MQTQRAQRIAQNVAVDVPPSELAEHRSLSRSSARALFEPESFFDSGESAATRIHALTRHSHIPVHHAAPGLSEEQPLSRIHALRAIGASLHGTGTGRRPAKRTGGRLMYMDVRMSGPRMDARLGQTFGYFLVATRK